MVIGKYFLTTSQPLPLSRFLWAFTTGKLEAMSIINGLFYLTGFTGSIGFFSFYLPPLAALGFCPSFREGQKNNKNHVNPVYPV